MAQGQKRARSASENSFDGISIQASSSRLATARTDTPQRSHGGSTPVDVETYDMLVKKRLKDRDPRPDIKGPLLEVLKRDRPGMRKMVEFLLNFYEKHQYDMPVEEAASLVEAVPLIDQGNGLCIGNVVREHPLAPQVTGRLPTFGEACILSATYGTRRFTLSRWMPGFRQQYLIPAWFPDQLPAAKEHAIERIKLAGVEEPASREVQAPTANTHPQEQRGARYQDTPVSFSPEKRQLPRRGPRPSYRIEGLSEFDHKMDDDISPETKDDARRISGGPSAQIVSDDRPIPSTESISRQGSATGSLSSTGAPKGKPKTTTSPTSTMEQAMEAISQTSAQPPQLLSGLSTEVGEQTASLLKRVDELKEIITEFKASEDAKAKEWIDRVEVLEHRVTAGEQQIDSASKGVQEASMRDDEHKKVIKQLQQDMREAVEIYFENMWKLGHRNMEEQMKEEIARLCQEAMKQSVQDVVGEEIEGRCKTVLQRLLKKMGKKDSVRNEEMPVDGEGQVEAPKNKGKGDGAQENKG